MPRRGQRISWPEAVPALVAFGVVTIVGLAGGGFFPRTWRLSTLALLCFAAAASSRSSGSRCAVGSGWRSGRSPGSPRGRPPPPNIEFVVVFDPSAGFVTGGWITSPPGAYTLDPTATGKATFGFVSKYQKGATVPTGSTELPATSTSRARASIVIHKGK